MAPSTTYSSAKDAKDLFDMIGKDVHDKVHGDALDHSKSELKGLLSEATFSNGERVHGDNPCKLNYEVHTNVSNTVINPCERRSSVRFSDTKGAECNSRRIRGTNGKMGACAPYRRLHLCDRNLEQIKPSNITSTHNLLLDVCMAAKFEGDSITGEYLKYQNKYGDSPSQICTMLARSFADIGDIIRGKDHYLGNNQEKEKLQENLRQIFKKIYDNLKNTDVREHYKDDDKGTKNYYKLRNDWWALNRKEVWKALTCDDRLSNSKYFRFTCSKGGSIAHNKCTCANGDVPTYFDYVPQFLRWFEEWAEDFCRKRKHKLENAIKNCRENDKDGNQRYCDLNGYDCKRTAKGEKRFVQGDDCYNCSVTCIPFGPWIDNQKQEFDKQKNKYENEIKKEEKTIQGTNGKINNTYEKDFYERLKTHYESVEEFFKKLNDESICKKPPQVGKETADAANFTNDNLAKTFDHTTYCQACPWCGMKCTDDGKCTKNPEGSCNEPIRKKVYDDSNTTTIPVLTPDKSQQNILKKYRNFCKNSDGNNGGQIKNWECHYDDKGTVKDESDDTNDCIQGEWKDFQKDKTFRSYYYFFWIWVTEMLIDSIEWRTHLKSCINNESKQCKNGCKNPCECYKRWVDKKKTEWKAIKDHFGKQKDIVKKEVFITLTHDAVLETLLDKKQLLQNIKEAYGDVKETEHIKDLLDEENEKNQEDEARGIDTGNTSIIDKLLKHEEDEAEKCVTNNPDNECPKKSPESPGGGPGVDRSLPTPAGAVPSPETNDQEHLSDFEEEEEGEDEVQEGGNEDTKVNGPEEKKEEPDEAAKEEKEETHKTTGETTQITKVDGVKPPCDIVKDLFEKPQTDFTDACDLKYNKGKHYGWRCIPTEKTSDSNTRESSLSGGEPKSPQRRSAPSGKDTGSVCVPPRRRRLYIQKLHDWANNSGETFYSEPYGVPSPLGSVSTWAKQSPSNLRDGLRDAFIESAAIETFFLWHRYKKIKEKERQEEQKRQAENGEVVGLSPDQEGSQEDDPEQKQLNSGTIPEEFKRQMFYTLGDYRDILFSGSKDEKSSTYNDILKGDKVIQERESKIKETIDKVFPNSDNKEHSVTTPQTWWKTNGEHIWNGMICALTHKTDNPQEMDDKVKRALLDDSGKKPKSGGKYEYNTVKLEENSGGVPKSTEAPTHLSEFVVRPTYFRYLEEWGETFCRQRAGMLKQVEKNCTQDGDGDTQKYSGDGEDCETIREQNYDTVPNLEGPSCATPCGLYKRWIRRKKDEYNKQKSAYEQQKTKYENGNTCSGRNNDKEFCVTLERCSKAAEFLEKLGACSKNNENGKDILDFNEPEKTFGPATNCAACPLSRVKCKSRDCSGGTVGKCGGKPYITIEDIKKMKNAINVDMLVIDKNTKDFANNLTYDCKDKGIFEGIRKDQWTCAYICDVDICVLENSKEDIVDKQNILIRALFKRWLENFLEDYNKIKHKISHCTKTDQGSKCISGCEEKCKCVEQWIAKKREEWKKIKKRYIEQYNANDSDHYNVKNFLQQQPFNSDFNNAIKPCKGLENFEKSCGLNGTENSPNGKEGTPKDIVECLFQKLKEKAETCPGKPSGEKTEKECQESSPEPDDEPLEEEENPENMRPKICPPTKQQPEEPEGECKAAESPSKDKKEGEGAPPPPEPPADSPPAQAPVPSTTPKEQETPSVPPTLSDQPTNSISDILSSTIPFGIAIALTSIVFLFLK
ncbi:hypothetical protein PFMALIP_05951, partial [Plasmodium falciparum MaliPS096_E11]